MPLDCFESNLAFASAYCTMKTAWQLPVLSNCSTISVGISFHFKNAFC